ncbi:tRNA (N(6)-L-threonylcarbamoyladenosine(37)-C(2))-methylthiotransferase MtaB [Maritalea mediterranea]|uniref:tRNA (N(6)-L-threonylcarbamoyladenosine(37)-C(2))-methylthiotransferase n=1 Tax=Maritalea mediterranea TaxID=2909667 RepID=A0ABS9E202_9HYPH|nr:tRNA (N(6)-L-threonylcarbamoyladenosine(37)-C(2))-methylthiotransferase MtaB [Maritalea mediterranea]MCF4096880.1 tRNA (N(6)-L-threonylcarbamoyladenosine(37)-C(2))-methylthiotransferase MtaB [Maritalea mediterranea]
MSIETLTFGCRLNAFESEVMKDHAGSAGLDNILIVNSCAVTQEAVRQTRQAIRKARRENPDVKIVVTGCAAQTDAESFAEMGEVDLVVGNGEKMKRETYEGLKFGIGGNSKILVDDIMSVKETAGHLIEGMDGRARAFVQVQNGCDHRCTFCIIPYGRGPSRSVPMGVVVDQIKKLADNGIGEVVLTGVDITSYGPDLPGKPSLGALTQSILKHVPQLPRLRISSIDSIEADEALMEAIKSEHRLMPHLHLSLQSGDNMILKRMKRRHLREDTIQFVNDAKAMRPDMVFGADIIAGFPTETDEMFANSMAIVKECDLTYLHVFPYSPRPGTPAAKMPQVDKKVAKDRAAKLRALGEQQFDAFCASQMGDTKSVLIERDNVGRTEQFVPIKVEGAPGEILDVKVTGQDQHGLIGEKQLAVA